MTPDLYTLCEALPMDFFRMKGQPFTPPTPSKPFKVHVTVCGTYAGAYEFETLAEAQADLDYRKRFEVLGCYYRLEDTSTCPVCDGGHGNQCACSCLKS
jgi:hypothetical protein